MYTESYKTAMYVAIFSYYWHTYVLSHNLLFLYIQVCSQELFMPLQIDLAHSLIIVHYHIFVRNITLYQF